MSSEENPADRSGDVDRKPLKQELKEITGGRTCPSCKEHVDIEEEEILSVNGHVVHRECFFEDVTEEVDES